jgi:hypothetical protein
MFPSPVPAYRVSGADGAIASAPIASEASLSDFAVHVAPPSVVFQTPPRAADTYIVCGVVGWIAMPVMRPVTRTRLPFSAWPFGSAAGPSGTQLLAPGTVSVGRPLSPSMPNPSSTRNRRRPASRTLVPMNRLASRSNSAPENSS